MRILHISLACNAYVDGWNYQENCIPKYHALDGHTVELVTVQDTVDQTTGKYVIDNRIEYIDLNNVKVHRLRRLEIRNLNFSKKFRVYKGLYSIIENFQPDLIFVHGIQFLDARHVIKYAKNHKLRIVIDSHEDYYNSARTWFSRWIVHGLMWRWCAKKIEPYAEVIWGTLPIRCDFMVEVYGMPREKVKLLVMGAEDEKVRDALTTARRQKKRAELGIDESRFVVVSAGKLNAGKSGVINLMQAVNQISDPNLCFFFAGSVEPKLRSAFDQQLSNRVRDAGWQSSEELYRLMGIADLIVFPGSHSVLWEQAIALGKPCVFQWFKGMDHLDLGGNCLFINDISTEALVDTITKLYYNRESLVKMETVAVTKGMQVFSYQRISRESIAGI